MGSYWEKRMTRTSYRFMRVDRATGNEVGIIPFLKGGTITRNNDVRIMETAETNCTGKFDLGPDFVRVYLEAEWADGHTESVVLGTFLPVAPTREVRTGYSTSTVKMYGRLQELLDDKFATPVVIEKGTNAVKAAADVCRQQGLTVIADPSDYVTTNVRTYGVGVEQNTEDSDDTKLGMVNDLLSLAGFRAAKTDVMGNVLLRKYTDPMAQGTSWDFIEGENALFESSVSEEHDITNVANHIVTRYENEDKVVIGEAYDTDPNSPLSTISRGRVITQSYTYNDLPDGKTDSERQAHANRTAASKLKTAQATILRATISHPYVPITVNDSVNFNYKSGGINGIFEVRTQKLSLTGGCPVSAELRHFVRR